VGDNASQHNLEVTPRHRHVWRLEHHRVGRRTSAPS
jgi:hypothetical protein